MLGALRPCRVQCRSAAMMRRSAAAEGQIGAGHWL